MITLSDGSVPFNAGRGATSALGAAVAVATLRAGVFRGAGLSDGAGVALPGAARWRGGFGGDGSLLMAEV